MKQLKNWKIRRSGSGLAIDFDGPRYGYDRSPLTRVKGVSVRDGKIIAEYEDTTGKRHEAELLPPAVELPAYDPAEQYCDGLGLCLKRTKSPTAE